MGLLSNRPLSEESFTTKTLLGLGLAGSLALAFSPVDPFAKPERNPVLVLAPGQSSADISLLVKTETIDGVPTETFFLDSEEPTPGF